MQTATATRLLIEPPHRPSKREHYGSTDNTTRDETCGQVTGRENRGYGHASPSASTNEHDDPSEFKESHTTTTVAAIQDRC
jgi:hypothetical protein